MASYRFLLVVPIMEFKTGGVGAKYVSWLKLKTSAILPDVGNSALLVGLSLIDPLAL